MNSTLTITRETNAQHVFSYLETVHQQRKKLQEQSTRLVPAPSIRVREDRGVVKIYVPDETKGKQTVASRLSPTKRNKRMKCAALMFEVANRFLIKNQLQNDPKAKTALAEIKRSKKRILKHDIKADEMRALLESILKRPAEVTMQTARVPKPVAAQSAAPDKEAPRPVVENHEKDQVHPARNKRPRPRLKNITRPLKAAAQQIRKPPRRETVAAEILPAAAICIPAPEQSVATTFTIKDCSVASIEQRHPADPLCIRPEIESRSPMPFPTPQDKSASATSTPSRSRNGFLAFFSWIASGLANFFKNLFR